MKTRYLLILVVAFVISLGLTAFSYAEEGHRGGGHEGVRDIQNRMRIAHEKIDRGIQSGSLTREEAHRLKGELNAVRDDEARMRSDGRLNPHERDRLDRELDRLERHIANLKQNDNRRDNDRRDGDRDRHRGPSCHENCDRAFHCERRCDGMGEHKHKKCMHECEKDKNKCKEKCDKEGHR
jgi:hypothetical protein